MGFDPSVTLAIVICSCAFFFGRFTVNYSLLSSSRPPETVETLDGTHQRALRGVDGGSKDPVQPELRPLDSANEQEWLKASGLYDVRPPLAAGASGDNFMHVIPFQVLSWYPRVVVYPNFIDKERARQIIKIANDTMYPSGVAFRPGEAFDRNQQTRTSTGAYLSSGTDPTGALRWLEERIAAISLIKPEYGEPFNVLHYKNLQHYDSHYDTFDPKDFGPQHSQRIATVITVLKAPEEGGETVFKREGENGADRAIDDWRNCDGDSFKYTPREGDAVMFWAVKTNGVIDEHALHGACPVKSGEKWVAVKWIRNLPIFGNTEE